MADLPDPVVRFGVALAVAILWVAKGYVLSVYRGDREFRVMYAAKTVLLGVVAGALGFVTGGDVATAAAIAVPFVDDSWNRFSATWNRLEDLPVVERFERVADQLVDEHGDEAADRMDETRKRLTGKYPTDNAFGQLGNAAISAGGAVGELAGGNVAGAEPPSDVFEKYDLEPPGQTGTPAAHPKAGAMDAPTPGERAESKVNGVPGSYDGYQKLRAVAGQIPSINGNQSAADLRDALLRYNTDSEVVLDAFATVEARERGEARAEKGGGSP